MKAALGPWRRQLVKDHHRKMMAQIVLIPLVPFLYVFIQAIVWPGPRYCNENSCPTRDRPVIPDAVSLGIVLPLYAYTSSLALLILGSSGAWMENALRNKLIATTSLFLMLCSCFQLIAPACYRTYVIPYYGVHQYNFSVIRSGDLSAQIQLSDLYSSPFYPQNSHVMVQVNRASGHEKSPLDLSPTSKRVYYDKSYSDATIIAAGTNITRAVENVLQDGQWYMWQAFPSRKGVNGNAYIGRYLSKAHEEVTFLGKQYNDPLLDLRAFKLCKWNKLEGCTPAVDGSIH